jgi:hypothetical protein
MPTAIARMYVPEGFVIAADGRGCDEKYNVLSENCQKIFGIQGCDKALAYAFAGTVQLDGLDPREVAFDFAVEAKRAIEKLEGRTSRNLVGYAHRLSGILYDELRAVANRTTLAPFPAGRQQPDEKGSTITRLFVEGYFQGLPERIAVRFSHEDQRLSEPEVYRIEVLPGRPVIHGSPIVTKVLFDDRDERLRQFKEPDRRYSRLEAAVEITKNYIRACSSPEGLALDQDVCRSIGGHIHVATVTPDRGFQWVEGCGPRNWEQG